MKKQVFSYISIIKKMYSFKVRDSVIVLRLMSLFDILIAPARQCVVSVNGVSDVKGKSCVVEHQVEAREAPFPAKVTDCHCAKYI